MKCSIYRVAAAAVLIACTVVAGVARMADNDGQSPGGAADSLMQVGIRLAAEARYPEAIAAFSSVAVTEAGSASLEFYRATCYEALNDIPNARLSYEHALAADSMNARYRFRYGKMLVQTGAVADARAQYERILEADPAFLPACFSLGALLYEARVYDRAEVLFRRVAGANPCDFVSIYYLGAIAVARADVEAARALLAECLSINPEYYPALLTFASLESSGGRYDESLRLYSRACAQRPENANLHYKIGMCYYNLDDNYSAIDALTMAADLDTTSDMYPAQLGYVYLLTKQYHAARAAYRRAVMIDDDNPLYYMNLALAYSKLDSTGRAVELYRRAIAACHPEKIAMVALRLGTEYYYRKEYELALSAYRQALESDPANMDARFYLALCYDQLTNTKEAIRQYKWYLKDVAEDTTTKERNRKRQAMERLDHLKKTRE